MMKSSKRLLVNAEAFGFGPTAAIAEFFPHLRECFSYLSYIGQGHTLELQQTLGYDEIYDSDALSNDEIESLAYTYDIFVTAMDYDFAQRMKSYGMTVVVYDALARYRNGNVSWERVDLYLAQNFFGVQEKLGSKKYLGDNQIVSPIIASPSSSIKIKKHMLINLGGLANPYREKASMYLYVQTLLSSILQIIPSYEDVVIVGSKHIADALPQFSIRTCDKYDMKRILESTSSAYMTSGLGNIYDAAAYNIPTVFLPPANDSQGQQLTILQDNDCLDRAITRSDISDTIVDCSQNQKAVIVDIQEAITRIDRQKLEACLSVSYHTIKKMSDSRTARLIKMFGCGGEHQVTDSIYRFAQKDE